MNAIISLRTSDTNCWIILLCTLMRGSCQVNTTYLHVAHRDGVDGGGLAEGDCAAGEGGGAEEGAERGRVGGALLRGHDEGLLRSGQLLLRHRGRSE